MDIIYVKFCLWLQKRVFFHKIFRLLLVLTPVSNSGKNSRIPFNGTLPKTTAVGIGFEPFSPESPSSTLLCSIPEIKEKTQNTILETESGSWGYLCVCPLFKCHPVNRPFVTCLLSLHDTLHILGITLLSHKTFYILYTDLFVVCSRLSSPVIVHPTLYILYLGIAPLFQYIFFEA
jgi:hypothetical protein